MNHPFSKLKRNIMAGFFVLLFLFLAPIIIFYANGHILGDGFSILPTGGIFIHSMDSGSKVFINDKLKITTSFFTRDYFLKNLRPGTYDILVTKDGYNEWFNQLTVYPNRVAESRVFMLLSKIELLEITEYLRSATSLATTSDLTLSQDPLELNPEYELINNLFATSSLSKIKNKTVATNTTEILDYPLGSKENPITNRSLSLWRKNSDVYLSWTGNTDSSPKIFCTEVENNIICQETIKIYSFDKEIGDLDYFPNETEIIIVVIGSNIYAVEAENNPAKKLQLLYQGQKPTFRIFKNNIYIKDIDLLGRLKI